jgi:erythromycin esterase-like protein
MHAPEPSDRPNERELIAALRHAARPITGNAHDYDELLDLIGDARFVLIGEASHGTHEFYEERIRITRRLIEERGFNAVAVEADWPDANRVGRFVRGAGDDATAADALGDFIRFPRWMWRNVPVLGFVSWLRNHNDGLGPGQPKVGFYGLDLYSLHASIAAVIEYLNRVDPEAARLARHRYGCFEHFGDDAQRYGYSTGYGLDESCEHEVVSQLVALQRRAADYAQRDGRAAEEEFFFAEQNARVARDAEAYYRLMYQGDHSTWNLRDRHMAETLESLRAHLEDHDGRARIVVWEHNSHLGDASATEMATRGELNVGQLVRQQWGDQAFLIGFSTDTGTVTAASDWDAPAERKRVRPALAESYEHIFHQTDVARFLLPLRGDRIPRLTDERLERAIGVIYRPETERLSHYFYARLQHQFDAVIHVDVTRAVEPLDRDPGWETGEPPETYPSAL